MTFEGLPKALPGFLSDLKANNRRDWFEEHRGEYDQLCVEPMLTLIEALAPIAEALDPPHKAEARLNGSLRRIHRDTRFSKDKTPYHTHLHLIFWHGEHPNRSPGIHLIFASDGFGIGAGQWGFDKDRLERYRNAVAAPASYKELEAALEEAGCDGQVPDEPALKKLPKGFDAAGQQAEMLRQKGLVVRTAERTPYDPALFGPGAVDYLAKRMAACAGIDRWLVSHVG